MLTLVDLKEESQELWEICSERFYMLIKDPWRIQESLKKTQGSMEVWMLKAEAPKTLELNVVTSVAL